MYHRGHHPQAVFNALINNDFFRNFIKKFQYKYSVSKEF